MAKADKYSRIDFEQEFPNEDACLEYIFNSLHSKECSCGGSYSKITGRKKYQCSKCRFQIAPTANTIFHKSDTPLRQWFHAIWIFSNAKSGISAKEMERQLGVTYKTAWRILTLIRTALQQNSKSLSGDVEMDSAYFGGVKKAGKDNKNLRESFRAKSVVTGAIERGGEARMQVTEDMSAHTYGQFLKKNVKPNNTRLMTDKSKSYVKVARGYNRHAVDHHRQEYVRGDVHINNMETFWSHVKRSIKGTHKVISKQYLQSYLNGFVFHYNKRHNDKQRFSSLLNGLLHA